MLKIELLEYEVLNDMLLLQWKDQSNSIVPLKPLRDNCPCANCSGETDVFGNVYKGPPQSMNDNSYIVSGIQPIGYYALRIFWKDGHSDGIFSFKFLKTLSEEINQS